MEPAVMTDCPSVVRLLYPYLDQEVDSAERDTVDAHLARCPGCRERYVDESQFLALLRRHVAPPKFSPLRGTHSDLDAQLRLPLTESETAT
jgi:predicted anti-sigma-YlaC factor YlaD